MLQQLCNVLPYMCVLLLDPVLLCTNYNNAHWHKKADGERLLRIIQNKFSKIDPQRQSIFWGSVYEGVDPPALTVLQKMLRS